MGEAQAMQGAAAAVAVAVVVHAVAPAVAFDGLQRWPLLMTQAAAPARAF